MATFDQLTDSTAQSRDTYRQNKAAAGGQRLTQQTINDTLARGQALSSPNNPNAVRNQAQSRAAQNTRAGVAPVPMPRPIGRGAPTVADYANMIAQSNAIPQMRGVTADAPIPATMSPGLAARRGTGVGAAAGAPIPATMSDQLRFDRETKRGIPVEVLAAGAAGAGVALIAREVLASLNKSRGETISKSNGVFSMPQEDVGFPANERPKKQPGSGMTTVPKGRVQSDDLNPTLPFRYSDGIIEGTYEVVNPGKSNRGSLPNAQKRLVTNNGVTKEVNASASKPSQLPGYGYRQQQITDADSPNFTSMNGINNSIDRTMMSPEEYQQADEAWSAIKSNSPNGRPAPGIVNQVMSERGISPDATPGVYRRLMTILGN